MIENKETPIKYSIKIKVGEIEISVEGSEKFVKDNFEELYTNLIDREGVHIRKHISDIEKDIENSLGFSLQDLRYIYNFSENDVDINYLELEGRGKQLKASLILLFPLKVFYKKTPIRLDKLSEKLEDIVDVSNLKRDLSNQKYKKYIKIWKDDKHFFVDILPRGIDEAKKLLKEQIEKAKSR